MNRQSEMDHERENELGRLVLKVANTIIRNRNRHLKNLGLTAVQADSLQYFLAHENTTITDFKEEFGITHQTACGIVARVAEKGYVELRRSSEDRRCQIVTPTETGIAMGERMRRNRVRTGGKLLDGLKPEEQAVFVDFLSRAFENIKND